MIYSINFRKSAEKEINNLPKNIAEKILKVIISLAENPHPVGSIKLKARDGYRIRIGNYRVVYEVQNTILSICIVAVGHRRNIYN